MNWNIEDWDAVVYVVDDLTLNEIDDIVAHRNDSQEKCEYLWSHPTYTKGGGNQSPYPIIIQQDRAQLMELRHGKKKRNSRQKRGGKYKKRPVPTNPTLYARVKAEAKQRKSSRCIHRPMQTGG